MSPEKGPAEPLHQDEVNYCVGSTQTSMQQHIRSYARYMRERSVELDKLADELEHAPLSSSSRQSLFNIITNGLNR